MADLWQRTKQAWKRLNPPDKDGYYECAICHTKVHISKVSIDHIIPWSLYPQLRYDLTNLQPAHTFCNQEKGNGKETARLVQRYGKSRKRIW